MTSRIRFHPVNSTALRSLRRQLGWSQAELGKRAGYCERVIRKAEAGGSLNIETIEHLVQTFISHNLSVSTRELIYSEESLARQFVDSYHRLGHALLTECSSYLTEDFVFNVPAEKSVLQLAGTYRGKDEFQDFLNRFFLHFERTRKTFEATFLSAKGRVVAHFEDTICYCAHELPPVWVNLHFYFREGLICRIDNQFDYVSVINSIESIRSRLGVHV